MTYQAVVGEKVESVKIWGFPLCPCRKEAKQVLSQLDGQNSHCFSRLSQLARNYRTVNRKSIYFFIEI